MLEVGLPARTGRPKYRQVADDLRAKIANGTYPVEAELPSTSRLMANYDVSITVVRAAVKELANEGLVQGQPGKAVYVRSAPDPAEHSSEYTEITQQIAALRGVVEDALAQIDARLTHLEQQTSGTRSPRKSP